MNKDRFIELLVQNLDWCGQSEWVWFMNSCEEEKELEELLTEYRWFVFRPQFDIQEHFKTLWEKMRWGKEYKENDIITITEWETIPNPNDTEVTI